jgi:hypothetical protein
VVLPGWLGPSDLPPNTYNAVLEPINAKRLWQIGQRELCPWPINGTNQKPDFVVGTAWKASLHLGSAILQNDVLTFEKKTWG